MAKTNHWLWPAFQNLVEAHQLTSQEAIERLSELYPSLDVLNIVTASAEGGKSKAGQSQEADPQDMNQLIRARAAGKSNQDTGPASPPGEYKPKDDPFRSRFNERLAQKLGLE